MKVAAVVVGTDDERFRRVDANRERMQLAERIAGFTKSTADVILLPAGFLAAKADREVRRHAESLAEVFGKQVLLAGVDESDETRSASKDRRFGKSKDATGNGEGHPFWVFASRNGKLIGGPWQQRSAFSGDAVSDPAPRCVSVGESTIGVLICGELYNRAIADSLAEAKPDLVVDLAHLSMKRFTRSLHRVAEAAECPVLHVQHVALGSRTAAKWTAGTQEARGDRAVDWASYNEPDLASDGLWAEVKLWKV
ncbi:MAG TPA: hypothetical protein VF516_16490 [Kofleriaceae bacterium]